MVPLKYPSNFWKTLEMHLINCETNVILSWSEKCVIDLNTAANQAALCSLCSNCNFINSR